MKTHTGSTNNILLLLQYVNNNYFYTLTIATYLLLDTIDKLRVFQERVFFKTFGVSIWVIWYYCSQLLSIYQFDS